ncbi:MAG: DUF1254 domain-containing protein [Gammaproteobacteria bacterium]|jgi:uncharacterized membrane protein
MSVNPKPLNWTRHLLRVSVVVVLMHGLTIWAVPRLIMDRIIDLGTADSSLERANGVTLPPPTDHTQRRIVMPSPDLLYATCFFDLADGPIRVTLSTDYPRYWSIALYASTSDNFFVVNDRSAPEGRVDLTILPSSHDAATSKVQHHGTQVVISPTRRGMLLMRLLVNEDPAVRVSAEAARRSLRCSRDARRSAAV